jgi:hypothetical protein
MRSGTAKVLKENASRYVASSHFDGKVRMGQLIRRVMSHTWIAYCVGFGEWEL